MFHAVGVWRGLWCGMLRPWGAQLDRLDGLAVDLQIICMHVQSLRVQYIPSQCSDHS